MVYCQLLRQVFYFNLVSTDIIYEHTKIPYDYLKCPGNIFNIKRHFNRCIFNNNYTTTVLWPFFRDHPGEAVPEENFWTLWCKGRLTGTDTLTIRLGVTPSGLTTAHLHHPLFFTGRMPFLPPNRQSTEGN